ncbi:terminase large subunit [Nitrospirillum bahiense]|uniref:Phage terminase large subunit-like protein n=1 Tax=Nitrospirillum amazonense TaxID=28077 RepID=A0A560FC69_9PROT|nr:terminase TerL endonuclease subunit [Nitrospirillum amazonense]TWB19199.1 phage terminase large subunit-like protein [Nitrospirillum amazonense]
MKSTYPDWLFDGSAIDDPFGYGQRAVDFLRVLRHPKSTLPKRAFQLYNFQERLVRRIYGPRHPDGRRIVRNVVMLLPRGGRKTSLGAGLGLLHTIGPERVPGGLALFAASDREQARIGFEEASGICREDGRIANKLRFIDYRHRIEHPKSGASLRAISCDAARQHGTTPTFALVDELHAWPKRDLWDVIRTGLTKVPGSLCVVITTAGRGQQNVAHDLIDYARRVARGDIDDPGTLPVLFETAADADWRDEALWYRANPGLVHGFPDIEGLRQLAREAENRPADREAFRQLHLNVWLDHSTDPFVEMGVYDQGAEPLDLDELEREPCWLGVDLSSNSDLTVVVACWRVGDGYAVLPHFFCPKDNLRLRQDRDGVPYVRWAEEGLIEPTPGNVVDFRAVEDCIRDLYDKFDVQGIGLDPHLARNTINNLMEDGLPAVEVRQGWVTMAPAIKDLERAIIGRQFQHGGHPVLRWCFDNIQVETDRAGNRLFSKGKARERIDGAAACATAVALAMHGEGGPSVYETDERPDGFLFI